jgi:hypothetical protein
MRNNPSRRCQVKPVCRSAVDQHAEQPVEALPGEAGMQVAHHHRVGGCVDQGEARKVLRQLRRRGKVDRAHVLRRQQAAGGTGRREDLVFLHLDAHGAQAGDDLAPRTGGGVGKEAQRQTAPRDRPRRLHRAPDRPAVLVEDAFEIEQHPAHAHRNTLAPRRASPRHPSGNSLGMIRRDFQRGRTPGAPPRNP